MSPDRFLITVGDPVVSGTLPPPATQIATAGERRRSHNMRRVRPRAKLMPTSGKHPAGGGADGGGMRQWPQGLTSTALRVFNMLRVRRGLSE